MTPDLWMTILFKMLLVGTATFGTLLACWRVLGWVYHRKLDRFIGYWPVFAMVIVCLMILSGIAVM
jgi:putative Mn2+ efflux pump MntP